MKKVFQIAPVLFLFACVHTNNGQNTSTPIENGRWAKFEIQKEFHNFGLLKDGELVSYPFWFKNSGDAPLKISGTEVDCGCVQVSAPENAIMPGDSAYVEVIYNSAGEVGKQLKTVTVFANTLKKKIEFHIAADVKNEWIELNN